jgi:hypothetical protein
VSWRTERHWRCKECASIMAESMLLSAPNPFDSNDVLTGCPKCKSVDCFDPICDVEDCTKFAGCGTPTSEAYRWTCGEHRP